jgi:membrane fusion protein, multidrug efflux system
MTPTRLRFIAVFALALPAVLGGCGKHEEPADPVRPVLTQKVALSTLLDQTAYSGEVRARYETDLGFRTNGKIIARLVEVGSEVKKGTVLAKLDPADAALSAQAARADVAAAVTEFTYAQAELTRYKELMDKGFIGQSVYESKLNAYNSAEAKLGSKRAQAAVSGNQSAYTSLFADQDGVITAVNAEVGQVVATGQAVFRLARPEEKEVVINAAETRVVELQNAQQVLVRLWAQPDKIYHGKLRELAPNADAMTRTFAAKITILDASPEVKLGMTANVLIGGAGREAALLPLTAVYTDNGKPGVWVVDQRSGKVELRPVQLGQYREDGVTILDGLKNGEIVVTAGVQKLVPGQVVRPLFTTTSAEGKKS